MKGMPKIYIGLFEIIRRCSVMKMFKKGSFVLPALECHKWSAALISACSAQWVTWLPSQ